jgi:hypothetical protein
MNTLFGNTPWPTPEEIQVYVRLAHIERSQMVRDVLRSLFHRHREEAAQHPDAARTLRPAS